jgi:hypothetical protein
MSDEAVIQLTQMSADETEKFVSKQYLYVNDSNNSSYSGGQITFDLSSLANSGRYIDWSEATIQLPVVFGFKFSTDKTGSTVGPFGLGFKCGWHQLIDSMEVMFGNTSVSQITPFSNIHTSFKMLTSFCQDQAHKFGALLNFFPDTSDAAAYDAAASVRGRGVSCNDIVEAAKSYTAVRYPTPHNEGLLKRLYNTNLPSDASGIPSWASGWSADNLKTLGKSSFKNNGGAADARVWFSQAIATIRLKDVSDFFAKLGLCKGAFIKLTINTNSGVAIITGGVGGTMEVSAGNITLQGRTLPIMVAANSSGSSLLAAMTAATNLSVGVGISSLTLPGAAEVKNETLNSCRIYAPAYQMTSEAEQGFLNEFPTRDIVYNDLYQYTIRGISAGQQFTQLISNAIVSPQYLLVVPFLSPGGDQVVSPLASPFASEPATASCGLAIGQYNVQLSGSNVYMQNQQYDFQQFKEELVRIHAVNGAQTDGMSSGLIGFEDWSSSYRYYCTDLSRGQPMDALVPKSIQVLGTNISTRTADYFCFVVYRRKITIRSIDSTIIA